LLYDIVHINRDRKDSKSLNSIVSLRVTIFRSGLKPDWWNYAYFMLG
jgi:hypothetical protein